MYLALYVDDGLLMASKIETIKLIINALENSFNVTAGKADCFVGMQIEQDRANKTVFIHQQNYVESILHKFKMCDAQAVGIPADPHMLF